MISNINGNHIIKNPCVLAGTYKGTVQLGGFVATQEKINKAGEVAGNVTGVKSVKNDMKLI